MFGCFLPSEAVHEHVSEVVFGDSIRHGGFLISPANNIGPGYNEFNLTLQPSHIIWRRFWRTKTFHFHASATVRCWRHYVLGSSVRACVSNKFSARCFINGVAVRISPYLQLWCTN